MNPITSIYIPHVEKHFNAEYVANIFNRNGIAQVSRVYIEPYKSIMKNRLNVFNRAYVEIKNWHETEAAYNFIKRLRNPSTEARIVHSADNWWAAYINHKPSKFEKNMRVLTVFCNSNADCDDIDDDLSCIAVGYVEQDCFDNFVQVDPEKTKALREIICNFKERELMRQEDNSDYIAFLQEIDSSRNLWYSEQYIWDQFDN